MKIASLNTVHDFLTKSYGLTREETEKVLETYGCVVTETLTNLHKAVIAYDNEDTSRYAHSLKGALLNLGLDFHASEASFLEKDTQNGVKENHIQLVEQLIATLHNIIDASLGQELGKP